MFDYKSPTAAQEINDYTHDGLRLVWDCTGQGGQLCAGALSKTGGKYSTIMPLDVDVSQINPNIDGPHRTLMYSVFGHEYKKGPMLTPVNWDDVELAAKFWDISGQLLAEGRIQVPRVFANEGGDGLDGVLKGMEMLKANKVSAGKLVYTLG